MAKITSWKNLLLKIHIYGGLFSVGFLITFSYSAFVHQHHPKFPKPGEKTVLWEQSLHIPEIEDNHKFKLAVRDSLELFGHAPWWKDYHDSLGVHHFMISRPGKQYWVTVPKQGKIYQIKEVRTGFLDVMIQLHPLAAGMQGHGKGPSFIKVWKYISLATALVLLSVILISIQFWLRKSFKRRSRWMVVGTIAILPVILIIFIWLIG